MTCSSSQWAIDGIWWVTDGTGCAFDGVGWVIDGSAHSPLAFIYRRGPCTLLNGNTSSRITCLHHLNSMGIRLLHTQRSDRLVSRFGAS